ncbi:VOC family protein [Nonomuraea rubra]
MHRSRLFALLIDTPAPEAEAATAFWAAALGATARPLPSEEQFISLHGAVPGLAVAVQAIEDGESRFHIDIESDDVEAETRRLIGLGAAEVSRWQECRILRAPGGHLMCVLPVESDPAVFEAEARVWP